MEQGKHGKSEGDLENTELWKKLEALLSSSFQEHKPNRLQLILDIFKTSLKLARENPGTLNLKITSTALKELRYSFKMFSHARTVPKITIFGSARVPENTSLYEFAKDFAAAAVKRKFMIITGGGPGIMAAGNEGAASGGFGLNIRLPFEQAPNKFIEIKNQLIHYKYFFTRKLFLVKEASAFAFFPGGFGTFDEAFEVLTLLQTGKSNLIPVVLMEPKGFGFWKPFCDFLERDVMSKGFISPNDKVLFKIFHSPEQALAHIEHFYSVYHSMRFVKDKCVVRLKRKISDKTVADIHKKFKHLASDGKFVLTTPLKEEENEPELSALTRLVFRSDRRDFSGLRELIDFINQSKL